MTTFNLAYFPERTCKPRTNGLTMVMDKGLSAGEAKNLTDSGSDYFDLLKFGFGTALITPELEKKIAIYRQAGLRPYFGGTLFELFYVRNQVDEFKRMIDHYKLDLIEISDGSIQLPHEEKLKYIDLFSKQYTVLSEVGSKIKGVHIPDSEWVAMMKTELATGAWKVIAEARESGTIGIYNEDGSANKKLIQDIMDHVNTDNVLWEAPIKSQQAYFIKLLGANVNLGNIATNEVIALEALRTGLRGDTFFDNLPEELQKFKQE
jgi:phosphosulfolactate synthase